MQSENAIEMRILQVTPTYPPAWSYGGITKAVYAITKELSKRGHEVEVWTSDALDLHSRIDNEDFETGAKVRYFKNLSFVLTRILNLHITPSMIVSATMELLDFDLVHFHGARTFQNLAVYPYAKKYSIPYVLQAHGSLPRTFAKKELKWFYDAFFGYRMLGNASKVLALTTMEARQYKDIGVLDEKIEIIPNGIDLSEYDNLPEPGNFRERYGLGEERLILYLGRMHRIKGIDLLLEAFSNISKQLGNVKLVLAGPDEGYLPAFQRLVAKLEIAKKVMYVGPLYGRQKLMAYRAADVYVLPSRYETFPMSVLEAVACGRPVILTDKCGIAEYFGNTVGLVVKPDSKQLKEALLEMLLNDERRETFEKNCKTVIQEFTISRVVSKFEKVYEEAVAMSGGVPLRETTYSKHISGHA